MTSEVVAVRDNEYATISAEEARDTYSSTQLQLVIGTAASLLVALTVVLLLVRNLVPRLRAYAGFAADVAAGRRVGSLDPRGSDELSQLGRALDDMVVRTGAVRRREREQAEFVDTLQVTAGAGRGRRRAAVLLAGQRLRGPLRR
jgi:methyl-accepting chemotaxis protein